MIQSNKLFFAAITLLLAMVQQGCNSDDDTTDDVNAQCEKTICTQVLIQINVSVTDMNQNPVALDSFRVTNMANGEDLTITLSDTELAEAQETGLYPLTQDGVLDLNQERQLQFTGLIGDQEVVTGNYTVSTDCCHVSLDSGNLELTL